MPAPGHREQGHRAAFGKPGLSWERDGERLMREYKTTWYERPVLPSVSVISDRLAPFLNVNRAR